MMRSSFIIDAHVFVSICKMVLEKIIAYAGRSKSSPQPRSRGLVFNLASGLDQFRSLSPFPDHICRVEGDHKVNIAMPGYGLFVIEEQCQTIQLRGRSFGPAAALVISLPKSQINSRVNM